MLRYVGLALVVFTATGLAVALGVVLVQAVPDRDPLGLTVFDGIAAVGGAAPRLRAVLQDADTGKPIGATSLTVRFADGWTGRTWTSDNGISSSVGPGGLAAGPHDYAIGLPEATPRLDVYAHGTVWVRPADTPVVWIDAAAIVPMGQAAVPAAAPDAPAARGVLDALKTLAVGRGPVYLVRAEAAGYASARRALGERGAPPGPAFWIRPADGPSRLQGLRGVWPRVGAALVCTPDLAQACEALGVPAFPVPPAGSAEPRAVIVGAWRDAIERWPVPLPAGTVRER